MGLCERLDRAITERPLKLQQAKDSGTKIVGISGLGYVPEELIYAAGAIPMRLVREVIRNPLLRLGVTWIVSSVHSHGHNMVIAFWRRNLATKWWIFLSVLSPVNTCEE